MSSLSFPRNPIKFPFHTFRGLVSQPLFFTLLFLSPVLKIFSMDVIGQTLTFMGRVYPLSPQTLWPLPLFFYGCVMVIAVVSAFWGRLFCGWVCPHNTLTEWTHNLRLWIGIGQKSFVHQQWEAKLPWLKPLEIIVSLVWSTAVSYIISVLFSLYFVPLPWFVQHFQAGTLPVSYVSGQVLFVIIGLFLLYSGHLFCKSACPYGLFQGFCTNLTAKWKPMTIAYKYGEDQSTCKSCHACQTACPVDIDPRKPENLNVGIGDGCFNCGECIDACYYVRDVQGKDRLLSFK